MQDVFVYGTLMAPEVLRIVLNKHDLPQIKPAVLHGYARHAIQHRVYPAIVPSAGHSVDGLVLSGLTPNELQLLCMFEAPEYALRDVQVQDNKGLVQETAATYVWQEEHRCEGCGAVGCSNQLHPFRHMLADRGTWSYAHFREQHLPEYLEMCKRWAASTVQIPQTLSQASLE